MDVEKFSGEDSSLFHHWSYRLKNQIRHFAGPTKADGFLEILEKGIEEEHREHAGKINRDAAFLASAEMMVLITNAVELHAQDTVMVATKAYPDDAQRAWLALVRDYGNDKSRLNRTVLFQNFVKQTQGDLIPTAAT